MVVIINLQGFTIIIIVIIFPSLQYYYYCHHHQHHHNLLCLLFQKLMWSYYGTMKVRLKNISNRFLTKNGENNVDLNNSSSRNVEMQKSKIVFINNPVG